ncbi:MAG: UDP-N-acetylglucosamine 2-epimerase (non-hydrolyzing) [Candidatus Omnitrophica bacterium]|nr:UDP-N-acetylglucosamine 2-epimerase (non-hydrolyzing) [Candidatus Omnitrophota bacterium]
MPQPHILIAVGARPNFMKAAPLIRSLKRAGRVHLTLVHTGQHYDPELSDWFLRDLKLPSPAVNLRVGSGSHARQTAAILERFESVVLRLRPDVIVVVGDVNSTVACALGCWKAAYPRGTPADSSRRRPLLAHVEAGLRSFDRSMPEEANRIVTDHLSDLLFAPSPDAVTHLRREGIPSRRIFFVGNIMIDSLRRALTELKGSRVLERLGVSPGRYALVTLHRPSNVDDPATSRGILRALQWLQGRLPVVFPMHPRTRRMWARCGLLGRLTQGKGMILTPALGYLELVRLMKSARLVLTDSGGIQEETTFLQVPCLTLRTTTERPITISHGTNRLVGVIPRRIVESCEKVLRSRPRRPRVPPRWDGRAAERISRILLRHVIHLTP